MDKKEILVEMDATMAELQQLLDSFSREQINIVPFEGSWTGGQLAQHLVMSQSGFVDVINGPVNETEREPGEKVAKIKAIFLDFNTKMKSPDFIVPPEKSYDKEQLLRSFKDINNGIDEAIENLDLAKTCLAIELPGLGFLTRIEAVYFILYHTQRHIHQLKNICQKIKAAETVSNV